MPYRYPPEFRRKVLDLLAAGRSVASLSADLGVSDRSLRRSLGVRRAALARLALLSREVSDRCREGLAEFAECLDRPGSILRPSGPICGIRRI